MRGLTWRDVWRQIIRNPLSITGLVIIVTLVLVAILAPYIAPHDPFATDPINKLAPPSSAHLMGTDGLGRDILSRVLYGTRISLWIAVLILLTAGVVGTAVGILAGYVGGFGDNLLMRITDIFMAFPRLILAMAIAAALGPSLTNVVIAISFSAWTVFARLARSRAIAVREEDYVEAARAVGASGFRIIVRHILPMAISPVIIQGTISMGGIILTAAGLGFLGFGAQPPTPEWGVMVSEGRNFMPHGWWVSTFPGLAIMVTVLGFNLLGDGIRDILDPRMR
ncbi:MAG: Binding-protein-dependent transport systems inner membrane component [Acetothermia bacterium 64_32]|nr:MAG: Binding-protein-dependent transport systems inner membrane component [Acetothermia bacterium 64_32]